MNDDDLRNLFGGQRAGDEQRAPSFLTVTRNAERANRASRGSAGRTFAPWSGWLVAGGAACVVALLWHSNPPQRAGASPVHSLSELRPLFLPAEDGRPPIFGEPDPLAAGSPSDFLLPESASNLFL